MNPNDHKRAEKARACAAINAQLVAAETLKTKELTLGDMAEKWLLNGVARKDGNAELRRRFAKDLYPTLRNKTLSSVNEHDLRSVVREANRQAIGLFADITQMFAWAEKRQPWRALLVDGNPTNLIEINKLIP